MNSVSNNANFSLTAIGSSGRSLIDFMEGPR